jgi:hypothetical protein
MDNKHFFMKFFCLLGLLGILDYGIGQTLEYFYFKQRPGRFSNVTYALEKQEADILILGSSRAMHHYNPDIISDTIEMSCFNAGFDGQGILYQKALLDVMMERYSPKMVIFDIKLNELEKKESVYDNLSMLGPYLKRHPVLWNTLSLKSPFEKIKHLSKIYPYNSMFTAIVKGNLPIKTNDVSDNGFTKVEGVWTDGLEEEFYEEEILDKNNINAFNQMIINCKNADIKMYVVLSPVFSKHINNSNSINYIIKQCEKEKIPYLSYANNDLYLDSKLFKDAMHLNSAGADLFSSDFAHLLKNQANSN